MENQPAELAPEAHATIAIEIDDEGNALLALEFDEVEDTDDTDDNA